MTTTKKMVEVKVAAKELGVAKGKIKDMIKNGCIDYKVIDGKYFVNIDSIQNAINNTVVKDRRYYSSVIPKDMYYTCLICDEFNIRSKWLKNTVNDIVKYWNDVGKHHKILGLNGTTLPMSYRLLPIESLKHKDKYEDLFGEKLDENAMLIWIVHYNDFTINSINLVSTGGSGTHTYKKEFKVAILNPTNTQIKIFDIDTKAILNGSMEFYEIIKKYSNEEKVINYNTSDDLEIGILSKPIGTASLIVRNDSNTIGWYRR